MRHAALQATRFCAGKRRAITVVTLALLLGAAGIVAAQPAYAFREPFVGGTGCATCHYVIPFPSTCADCHDLQSNNTWFTNNKFTGPHGNYKTTTSKCDACHSVHQAPGGSLKLLPAATIVQTCETCHDGTGGYGVYGAIRSVTGTAALGGHGIDTTSVVPGGNAATGGSTTMTFSGASGKLICTDCHNPHGANLVDPFVGDRRRVRADFPSLQTARLLRRQVGIATTGVVDYGSDWCLGCHAGRASKGTLMNHPVDSIGSTFTVGAPYKYALLPILASTGPTSATILTQGLGGVPTTSAASSHPAGLPPYTSGNRGYLMPFPRTAQQTGHAPICQQCHEDARSVGTLEANGSATASSAVIAGTKADGLTANDNPRFQNFPHETLNANMLVETNDNLCLNCHPTAQLP